MRWSEAQYWEWQRQHGHLPVVGPSERALQSAVIRLATQHGWLVHFAADSRRSPEGYPDLTLARPPQDDRPGRLIIAELKTQDGIVRLAQQKWLDTLHAVTAVETHLWRPEDMPEIVATLRGH